MKNPEQEKQEQKKRRGMPVQTPRFHLVNWLLLLAGAALIGLGFWRLWRGSVTLAPILLVAGYCVVVPLGLLLRPKRREDHD